MEGVNKIIIAFLLLLFVIIFVGVSISKVVKNKKQTNSFFGGTLGRIFAPKKQTGTSSSIKFVDEQEKSKGSNEVVIKEESTDKTTSTDINMNNGTTSQKQITQQNKKTTVKTVTNVVPTKSGSGVMYNKPTAIPATGAPVEILFLSASGLISGFYIRRKLS